MTTQKITLICDSAAIDGTLFSRGSARILPSARIPDETDQLLLEQAAARVAFTRSGPPSVQLFPSDLIGPQNDDSTPGWTYTIYYDGTPGNPQPWSFVLLSAGGDTQRLSDLAEIPQAVPGAPFLPTPAGTPSAGDVPIATGTGEATAWGSPGEASTGYPLEPVVSGTPSAGQVLTATDATHAHWATLASAPVTSVNTKTGVVTLTATDVGADASGAAATAQAAAEAYTDAETARAETAEGLKLAKASNLLDLASAGTARTNLGLGTAATHAATDFDASGAASTALTSAEAYTDAETSRATTAEGGKVAKAGDTMTGHLAPAVAALTFGTTISVDASAGNGFNLTLTASTGTIANPANVVDGQVIRFRISQDGTGSRTVAWGTAYDFGAGSAPTLSTAASKVDIVAFEYVASLSKWCCLGSGLGY